MELGLDEETKLKLEEVGLDVELELELLGLDVKLELELEIGLEVELELSTELKVESEEEQIFTVVHFVLETQAEVVPLDNPELV